jgi:hypothetical protein
MRTQVPSVDVTTVVPGLAAYARTTTRLHPRPGDPIPDASHVGGPVRWPIDESWPMCHADLPEEGERAVRLLDGTYQAVRQPPRFGARGLPHPTPNPMIAVTQLLAAEVPDLWCPPDADVLQVLWCPFDHWQDHGSTPTVRLFWRRLDPSTPVADPPVGLVDDDYYVPNPCVLHPEQVTEYPDEADLPADLGALVEGIGDGHEYAFHLSTAPGWKAGGWPGWTDDPLPMDCAGCGARMRYLLTIDTVEHGGGRWQPEEERDLPKNRDHTEPTKIVVGRWANLHFFVCTGCPDQPFRLVM